MLYECVHVYHLFLVCVCISLQHFVRGAGGFVSEMATAVLNGLTNNRHSSCMQKLKSFEDRKPSPAETSSTGTGGGGGEDGKGLQDLSMIDSENKSVADLGDVHHLESNQLAKGGDMCKENSEWGSESGEVSSERSKSADLRDADSKSREVSVEMSEVSVERSGSEEVGRDISRDSTSEKVNSVLTNIT